MQTLAEEEICLTARERNQDRIKSEPLNCTSCLSSWSRSETERKEMQLQPGMRDARRETEKRSQETDNGAETEAGDWRLRRRVIQRGRSEEGERSS